MKKSQQFFTDSKSDEQLWREAKNDVDALTQLIERYDDEALRLCSSFRVAGMERDDFLQEAYLGLLKAIRSFNPERETGFAGFASLCMKRQLLTAVKRQNAQKNKPLNQSVPFEETFLSSNRQVQGPENLVILKEEARQRRKQAITLLSPLEKETLLLYSQGFSYEEMAKKLKCPEKKVDNALQRIRRKLRSAQSAQS